LDYPVHCPHGNVIPGLAELGVPATATDRAELAGKELGQPMDSVATTRPAPVVIQRISEQVQSDIGLMLKLKQSGIKPGREVTLLVADDGVRVTSEEGAGGVTAELPRRVAAHVFVVGARVPVAGRAGGSAVTGPGGDALAGYLLAG